MNEQYSDQANQQPIAAMSLRRPIHKIDCNKSVTSDQKHYAIKSFGPVDQINQQKSLLFKNRMANERLQRHVFNFKVFVLLQCELP